MIDHPITPSPGLIGRWEEDWHHSKVKHVELEDHIATQAAQWGADQELEATLGLMETLNIRGVDYIRNVRRPKPPSLKEQALTMLLHLEGAAQDSMDTTEATTTIRRALEALPND
jgi:hypothetical protein